MLSHVPAHLYELVEAFGKDNAEAIAKFCNQTFAELSNLITSQGHGVEKASEIRKVQAIIAFKEKELLESRIVSVRHYDESFPDHKGHIEVIDQATAEQVWLA
jgi:hypothetical protein